MHRWPLIPALLLLLAAAGCADEVAPRWSEPSASPPAAVTDFDSPRRTVALEEVADVGVIRLQGRVEGRRAAAVLAPDDGRVLDTFVEEGAAVAADESVVLFRSAASRVAELEREILELERELAAERGDDDSFQAVTEALEARDAAEREQAYSITAPTSGVVIGTRLGLSRDVERDGELFSIVAVDDLFVKVRASGESTRGIEEGDAVAVRFNDLEPSAPAVVRRLITGADSVELEITTADPALLTELGGEVIIEVEPTLVSVDIPWVPVGTVHRRDGDSYLLIEDTDGALRRVDAQLGRRTEGFVEVVATTDTALVPGVVLVLP